MPLLVADGCSAGYPRLAQPVFSNVGLSVEPGEVVTIVGRSGSGKSTLLLALSGLQALSGGSVTIEGTPVRRGDPRVGLVLQHYGLFPWYTVRENVVLGLKLARRGERFRTSGRLDRSDAGGTSDRVREALTRVGLAGKESRYPRELSGGEQQRVALARTLVLEPRVLLLDEPFSALDALTREELQDQLIDLLSGRQIAVVMVTHSIDEAIYLGDRVGLLVNGDGPARLDLMDNPSPPKGTRAESRRTSAHFADACARARRWFREALGA
ncbi:MAG: ABC transporter ATP-binding protein [Spirochaetota bacterium]